MNFAKNDAGFVCANCGKKVPPLVYSSRNHCPFCLYSVHVDNLPGDRQNMCKGLLKPLNVMPDSKKGYILEFECQKCGKHSKNKTAKDDSFEALLSLSKDKRSNKIES